MAEVVPVSSSAQLSLLPWLLRWQPEADQTTFAAGLHAGSSVGVALALRADLLALDRAAFRRLLLSSLPAAAAGVVAQEAVEQRLGGPGPTAALLAGAGAVMWFADRRTEVRGVEPSDVVAAAIAQVLALAPGVSRSGAALTALRLRGVRRGEALRYSMLMSLPVTAGAGLLTAYRSRQLPAPLPASLAAGTALVAAERLGLGSHRVVTGAAVYRLAVAASVGVRLRTSKGST
ncbi:MAG: putative bacitracin resistance protein [Frankiales bacterium]|nr:putative bacitracin resistance protein [Frankiales bacterium]